MLQIDLKNLTVDAHDGVSFCINKGFSANPPKQDVKCPLKSLESSFTTLHLTKVNDEKSPVNSKIFNNDYCITFFQNLYVKLIFFFFNFLLFKL